MADPPSAHQPASPVRSPATAWAAYAACALAWLSAVPSFYWALGGTAGLDTVGGAIEELGRTRDPAGVALGIGAGVLKVAGALLALALVRPWGRAIPRRLLLGAAWAASMALIAYGGLLVAVGALVLTGRWSAPPARSTGRRCGGMSCCGTCGSWCGVSCLAWLPGTTVGNPAVRGRDKQSGMASGHLAPYCGVASTQPGPGRSASEVTCRTSGHPLSATFLMYRAGSSPLVRSEARSRGASGGRMGHPWGE
jgi:hypothetical protein